MATMAWSYPGKELFTVDEMIEKFEIKDIQTTAPIFDLEKLRWMNGEYIRKMDEKELIALIRAFDATVPKDSDELMKKILPLVKERIKTLSEFESLADFFFVRPVKFEWELKKDMLTIAKNALVSGSKWEHDAMEKAIRDASDKAGVKARDVFMELRIAITGKSVGPPLLESLEILGKEETLARLA